MKIQFNTDNHIPGREALAHQAEATVKSALGRLAEHITRVEVHLSDENGDKTVLPSGSVCHFYWKATNRSRSRMNRKPLTRPLTGRPTS